MRDAEANETSGELGSVLGGTLVGVSELPLVSVDPEYQDGWCALTSPMIRLSCVVRRCSIEDVYPLLYELTG